MSIKHTFKWILLVVIVVIGGLSVGTVAYIYTKVSAFDKVIAQGVSINETDISGLSPVEAKKKIQSQLADGLKSKDLIIFNGKISYKIPFSKLGSEYNIDEVLGKAYAVGHQGNLFEKYKYLTADSVKKTNFMLSYIYDKEKIHTVIESYMPKFHVDPVNATITRKNRQFVITPEIEGQDLDLAVTVEKVFNALDTEPSDNIKVEAVTKGVPAKYTSDSFNDIQNIVASFSTSYNNSDSNRNINLQVAVSRINTMILPGEIFSLAKQIEPISYASGYRNSKVIVNGKIEQGIGGGVCQIASTLYNTLLLTNLEIVSRQNHSLPVAYVPLGRDATYSTDAIDFKFKNNTNYPLFVEGYCENNKVYVNIFAHQSAKPDYEIKFSSVTTEVIKPPAPKYIDDPQLTKGTKVEELKALNGKKVKLYKLYYQNGTLVKKELINNSYYKPRAATIKVGTKISSVPAFNPQVPSKNVDPNAQIEEEQPIIDPAPAVIPDDNLPVDESITPDVIEEPIE